METFDFQTNSLILDDTDDIGDIDDIGDMDDIDDIDERGILWKVLCDQDWMRYPCFLTFGLTIGYFQLRL